MTQTKSTIFPEMISRNPSADIPHEGLTSHLVQAGEQQFIFMEFDHGIEVAAHAHNAQWGVVLDGPPSGHDCRTRDCGRCDGTVVGRHGRGARLQGNQSRGRAARSHAQG